MLAFCNKCRTTKDVKLQASNRKEAATAKAVCTTCGHEAIINDFVKREMVRKREFEDDISKKSFAVRCHACEISVEAKLDKQNHPRCLRCGSRLVQLSPIMVKTMKGNPKLKMTAEELEKWKLN